MLFQETFLKKVEEKFGETKGNVYLCTRKSKRMRL